MSSKKSKQNFKNKLIKITKKHIFCLKLIKTDFNKQL